MNSTRSETRNAAIRRVDFKKYTSIAKALLRDALAIVVCDLDGLRCWSLSRDAKEIYAKALAQLKDSVPDWPQNGSSIRRCTISDAVSAFLTSVQDSDGKPVAGLMVLVNHHQDADPNRYQRISDGMRHFAQLVGHEADLLDELDDMTRELRRRYEELNLIYDTQDSVKYFDEGQDAIRSLVRNSCEYTGSGYCALVMSDRATMHNFSRSTAPMKNLDALDEVIRTDLFEHLAFRKEVIVHNGGARYSSVLGDMDCRLIGCPVFDENNEIVGGLFLANDSSAKPFTSSDRKLMQVMAHKAARIIQANYDALTGMMTRNGFEYYLETGLYIVRYKQIEHTVLNINVDRLHVVNDTCGHRAGDALIKSISKAIRTQLSNDDVVARLGGGEFGVMLVARQDEDAEDVAERIRAEVRTIEFTWDKRRFQVSVSIGLATMEPNTESVLSVLSAAEVACVAAKDLGRDRVQVYQMDNTMLVRRRAQIHWLGKLHSALREDKFQLFCQPIKKVGDEGGFHHAEVLLRLEDDVQGMLSPDVFLGSAERYNLMPAIDRWVIRNTLKMLVANLPRSQLNELVWSINLSGQTLSDPNFLQFILDETRRDGIRPQSLCFEITETAAVENLKEAGLFIEELQKYGFAFSLDDFGSGLSSFAYLRALPVNFLKIDGAIAREVVRDPVSASMVRAITQIGRDMGLETIAEYVESDELETRLAELGVNHVQGYAIGKPRPLREMLVDVTSAMAQASEDDTCTVPAVDSTASVIQLRTGN